jgi:hypothetical protein
MLLTTIVLYLFICLFITHIFKVGVHTFCEHFFSRCNCTYVIEVGVKNLHCC